MKKYLILTDDYAAYRNTAPVPGKIEGHWSSPTDYLAYRNDMVVDCWRRQNTGVPGYSMSYEGYKRFSNNYQKNVK